ncbi:hypothetical protein [Microvirga lotononidis]|uniref:Uncharacterized protein n=1 Tax=Microvirga lotononidis TaxID=864069 RepID=I4YQF4_9HYPH|nr:hypothetical protein [Microvirga lotononidis]EIM26196.1 hypothetical protein MicloDRAFT_00051540 [Microvirga lotononidis]WQO31502.1 hypothetical protein U0023_35070 [Microvirga lotononidis]
MTQELHEALGFKKDNVVQMLVETSGLDPDDNELTFPVGAVAIIDRIERLEGSQGIALTLAIEGKIVNVFDEGDGLPARKFFEPVLTERDDTKRPLTLTDVKGADTYTHAAFVHGEDSEGDHEVGDLQDLFRAAWDLMTEEQKVGFLFTDQAKAVLPAAHILTE